MEHSQTVEGERQHGLKLEASKWRQAIKDSEKRLELDKAKLLAECRLESEKLLRDEQSKATREHLLATQKLNDEHKDAIELLTTEYESKLIGNKNAAEISLRDAVRAAEAATKERLNSEWESKLKSQVEEAWTDSATMWQAKLTQEKERLEIFKRDVTVQTQRMADERFAMQEKLELNEETLRRIEAGRKSELKHAVKDIEKAKDAMEKKLIAERKDALEELSLQQQEAIYQLEASHRQDLEERLRVEREMLSDEMDKKCKKMQQESEQLMSGLEVAINKLRDEKVSLSEELEKTATKLENTEDALYDLKQASIKTQKEHSLMTWQMMAGIQRLKLTYKQGIENFDRDAAAERDEVKRKMQKHSDGILFAALQYANIVVDMEAVRQKMHSIIVNHKAETLSSTRTQIKLMERELERLGRERDTLEEERDAVDDELEGLELQVRQLEEQIREHSRSSSMQNGRVNVAHARKKRRLDGELERILELIEQKRANVTELDEKIAEKSSEKDVKEGHMVEKERELVLILVEQQRMVLNVAEENKTLSEERGQEITRWSHIPWPPVVDPTPKHIQAIQAKLEEIRTAEENRR